MAEKICSNLEKAYHTAEKADDAADFALASAILGLAANGLWLGSSLAGIIACGLTVETGPGFLVCEAAAVSSGLAADAAIGASILSIASAYENSEITEAAKDDAFDAWTDCIACFKIQFLPSTPTVTPV